MIKSVHYNGPICVTILENGCYFIDVYHEQYQKREHFVYDQNFESRYISNDKQTYCIVRRELAIYYININGKEFHA